MNVKSSRVTLKQISDACGLSLSTVSAALNHTDGRYNAETVAYVRGVAERLGYRINHQAKILRGGRSGLIGIIKNISLHQVTSEIAIHAGAAIRGAGYRFFSSDLFVDSGGIARSLDIMQDMRAEGILIENLLYMGQTQNILETIIKNKTPVMLIDGYPYEGVPHIGVDYYKGFSELTQHFIECGYRDIALALSENDFASVKENFNAKGAANRRVNEAVRAVQDVLSQHRMQMALMKMPANAESKELKDIYFSPGGQFIEEVTKSKKCPRAIIFINDLFAMAALRACVDNGVNVPGEIAIAGCDGSAMAQYTIPRLTSLEIPVSAMAREAVRLLVEMIDHKTPVTEVSHRRLAPKLVVQESCGGQKYANLTPCIRI